ncbi:bacterial Ig-like domain protein [Histomonas meleagridis]|nr:bacterial Ig-like domain protein [Histomonas meleagridis]
MYLPLTAVLKIWMEGGYYTYENISYNFTALGTNHTSGEQIIHVTPVSKGDFDNMSLDEMKKYDVIVIGFMDANGDFGTWFPEDETVQRVSEYIDLGYGVLFGHDVVGYVFGNEKGYGQVASKFGILLGTEEYNTTYFKADDCSNGTFSTGWMHYSDEFRVTKRGLLTNYPYSIPDGNLTCFETHTCSNAAFGDVWAEMGRNTQADIYNYSNFTEAENYAWNLSGYTEPRYGNPHYYLTTYKNTAMIQTGHTFASATLYERQLLTNTIYYLYQKTSHQYLYDNSIETPTLKSPNITTCGYRSIEIQM